MVCTCPVCTRPSDAAYRPFCSRRCADVDLARWLNGSYAIPADTLNEDSPPHTEDRPGKAPAARRDAGPRDY